MNSPANASPDGFGPSPPSCSPLSSSPTDPAQVLPDREAIESRLRAAEDLVQSDVVQSVSADRSLPPARLDKLIIQIPCFNEAETLAITLGDLPRQVAGVRAVEWLIIDDGSSDATVEVARQCGVDHIVSLPRNRGLARAFQAGLEEAVRLGADVIVNTDADNQYQAADIERLVAPIVAGQADMVIGERPIMQTRHFSLAKKILQRFGSWVVRKASSAAVADAPSGFRALSRATAKRLNVFTDYTYTLETIIQAGQNNMAVVSVPIRTNPDLRPSRLLKSIPSYVRRSATTILRIFMTYRPLAFFGIPGLACCLASLLLCTRYLVIWMGGNGGGHIQSLILAAILMSAGLLGFVVGLVGDLISVNRKLLEKVDWQVRQIGEQVEQLRRCQVMNLPAIKSAGDDGSAAGVSDSGLSTPDSTAVSDQRSKRVGSP